MYAEPLVDNFIIDTYHAVYMPLKHANCYKSVPTEVTQVTVYPPSTRRSAAVTYDDASESKKVTAPMRSSG